MNKARVNVLVVDDESTIRRLLWSHLSVRGFRVAEVTEGQVALDLFTREPPELVIFDLGLPDIDGMELLRRIRAASTVPVVVLSSTDRVRVKVEAFELGANDYVTKPFNMDELVARLHAALRHGFHQRGEDPVFRNGNMTIDLIRVGWSSTVPMSGFPAPSSLSSNFWSDMQGRCSEADPENRTRG